MDASIQKIEREIGRTIDDFVTEELGYNSTEELHKALAAEQIDSVAMAIYQMKKGKAMIIGDQTGVGKGRQVAALIRWANRQGKKPIFMTKDAKLFSDMYRDLRDIGSGDLNPLILNAVTTEPDKETGEKHFKDTAGVMLDEDGKLIYQSPGKAALDKIIESGKVPDEYDYVVLTYSQLNSGDAQSLSEQKKKAKDSPKKAKSFAKTTFIRSIANDNYILLDESHTAAGGDSKSGGFLRSIMKAVKGVTFASATFAKRPDTMPLYAIRSAMSEANVEPDKLIGMIEKGGVTLQEIMARALTRSGQMVRRERDMSDVKTDWKTVDDPATAKKARADYNRAIEIFNKIIQFQRNFITPVIDDISRDLAEVASSASETSGTKNFGVENPPFVSQTYNFTKQLMLALKAEAIVDEVVKEIKAGRHPVIALENTYESGLDGYNVGDKIEDTSFSGGLTRSFARILQYTVTDPDGNKSQEFLSPEELGPEAAKQYYALQDEIKEATKGIFLSPLDLIKQRLSEMGYKVGEVTGRKTQVVKEDDGYYRRERAGDSKRAVRDFNSGASDVIIINKSGATGISLHASVAFKDQRPRSMIIAQPLGDINDYMQMIGRIDRTGQVHRGYYINLSLPVPAELRFNMMLASKLKSLNANTTTSQESDTGSVEAPDFLNKYGSQVVIEYLRDNPDVFSKLVETGMKLGSKPNFVTTSAELENYRAMDEDIQKVTGRIALLPVEEQEKFYADISERYNTLIKYLDETGENTLKITTLPLKAKTIARRVGTEGKDPGGNNPFAQNSYVERVEVDVLRKPMKADEIRKVRETLTGGKEFGEYRDGLVSRVNEQEKARLAAEEERYNREKEKTQKEIDKQVSALEAKVKNMDEVTRKAEISRITGRLTANLEEKHKTNVASIKSMHRKLREKFEQFNTDDTYLIYEELEGGNLLEGENAYSPALFCGFKTAKAGENLTPSTSVAVFATLDGRRRLEIKFTSDAILDEISNFTNKNYWTAKDTTIDNWDSSISNASREERYILTGNILQAWDDATKEGILPGRLVSYTDIDGNIHDGILMNQSWQPTQLRSSGAPINSRTEQILKGETVKSTDGEVEIEHDWGDMFILSVPKTKKAGAKYFEDKRLLDLIFRHQGFHQYRGRFTATIHRDNMRTLLNMLSDMGVRIQTGENENAWEELNRSGENLSNPIDRARAITTIDGIAKKLGVEFEEDSSLKAKGAFNPKTGKIRINIDAHRDSADLEATLLHEAVAHYGLRKLFGKDWKELRMRLYEQASPEIKARVDAIAKADGLSTEVAMEEYIAQLAEDGRFDEQEESFWQKIVSALKQLLAKIGFNSGYLTDEDFRAMLYASYRNLQTGGALETAARVGVYQALRRNADASHEDNGPEDDGPDNGPEGGAPVSEDEDMLDRDLDEGADLEGLTDEEADQVIDNESEEYYRRDLGYAEAQTADDMYDRATSTVGSALYASQVDEYAPLDDFQEAIVKEKRGKDASLTETEKVSNRLRELGGRAMNEVRRYSEKFLKPMWGAIKDFRKAVKGADGKKLSMEELTRYVGMKSGLERNELFAKRDAKRDAKAFYDKKHADRKAELNAMENEERTKLKVRLDGGLISDVTYQGEIAALEARMQQLRDRADADHDAHVQNVDNETAGEYRRLYGEYRQKDYSGLMAWFTEAIDLKRSDYPSRKAYQKAVNEASKWYVRGITDLASAEAAAKRLVDDIERQAGSRIVGNLWDRINAATKETLELQYQKGMISRQQKADIAASMKFYIPMRGFEDETAEDLYSYYMKPNASGFAPTIIAAKGRRTRYRSPFGMIGFMHSSAVSQGMKNEAKLSLLDFVRRHPKNTLATISRAWFVQTGEVDEDGKPIYEVAYPQVPEGATVTEREAAIEAFEQDMAQRKAQGQAYNAHREVQMNGGVVAFERDAHKTEHVIRVMEGGREYGIIVNGNPAAAQAVNGIKRQGGYENFLEILRATRRVMSQMFTTFSIPFWISNFQRDHGQGFFNTFVRDNPGYVGRYILNRWKILPQMLPLVFGRADVGGRMDRLSPRIAEYYRMYLENGGPMGQNRIETDAVFERQLERYLRLEAYDKAYIVRGASAVGKFLGSLGEAVETITRFSTFVTSMEYGRSVHEAISDSKEVSTNFARKGHGRSISWEETGRMETRSGRQLGDTSGSTFETYRNYVDRALIVSSSAVLELLRAGIPFFNAAIQGMKNKVDTYKKNWVKALMVDGICLAAGFAMRFLLGDAGGDDDKEKYGHTSDYARRNNLLLPLDLLSGDGKRGGMYSKWALPQEYRYMYALGDIIAEGYMKEKPLDDLWVDAFEAFAQVLPAGAVDPSAKGQAFWIDALKSVAPGAVTPIIEAFENRDFKGSRIYNEGFNGNKERDPGWTKAIPTTGKGYVKAAEWLNKVTGGDEENATVRGWLDLNPAIVEHFVQSYLSGPYQVVGGIGTLIGKAGRGEDITTRDIPVWNRMFLNTNDNSRDAYYSGLYYYFKDRDKEARRLDAGMKGHNTRQHQEFLASKDHEYMLVFKRNENKVRALNKQRKNALEAGDDAGVKRIDAQLDGIREDIAKECLAIYFRDGAEDEVK